MNGQVVVITGASAGIGRAAAEELVKIFLETPFAGGRHERRVEKIAELENEL